MKPGRLQRNATSAAVRAAKSQKFCNHAAKRQQKPMPSRYDQGVSGGLSQQPQWSRQEPRKRGFPAHCRPRFTWGYLQWRTASSWPVS
jgi:hypothetical protein